MPFLRILADMGGLIFMMIHCDGGPASSFNSDNFAWAASASSIVLIVIYLRIAWYFNDRSLYFAVANIFWEIFALHRRPAARGELLAPEGVRNSSERKQIASVLRPLAN